MRFAYFTCALVSLSLAASCGDDDKKTDTSETTPETSSPDTSEPETAPDTSEPETAPDTPEPDTIEPDTIQPDTGPDTTEPDTGPDIVEPSGDFACLGEDPQYPIGTGEVAFDILLADIGSGAPIGGATVRMCARINPSCTFPLSEIVTGDDGIIAVRVPAGFDGFMMVEAEGRVPLVVVHDPPIVAAPAEPQVLGMPTWDQLEAVTLAFGERQDPGSGQVLVTVRDCALAPAPGATVTVASAIGEPETPAAGYFEGPLPAPDAIATDATGRAGLVNLAPGFHTVRAVTAGGDHFGRALTLVRPGALTIVSVTPQQNTADLSCGDRTPRYFSAEGDVTYPFVVRDFVSTEPIAGAHLKVCQQGDMACATPLAEGDSDAEGRVSGTFAFAAHGFDGFIEVTGDDLQPTRLFFEPPLAAPSNAPTVPLFVDTLTLTEMGLFAQISGATVDPEAAQVAVLTLDCKMRNASGMSVTLDRTTPATKLIYLADGLPAPAATATDGSAIAGIFNVPADAPAIITERWNGAAVGSIAVEPTAGFLHLVSVVPSPIIEATRGTETAAGMVDIAPDGLFAEFFRPPAVVRFSNAPDCVLWTRDQTASTAVSVGDITIDGSFIGTEGLPAEPVTVAQACGYYSAPGPLVPAGGLPTVEVTVSGSDQAPPAPVEVMQGPLAELVTLTSPEFPETGLELQADEPLTITWEVPPFPVEGQHVYLRLESFPEYPLPSTHLSCAFPLSAGEGTIPANIMEHLPLEMSSGNVYGYLQISAGSMAIADVAGGGAYVYRVLTYPSTSIDGGNTLLVSPRVAPPAPEVPVPEVLEPSGPAAPGGVHCVLPIGGSGGDTIADVALTPSGDFIVAGRFDGEVAFDDSHTLSEAGTIALFIARYTTDCELVWIRQAGGPNEASASASVSLALGDDDSVYLAGRFYDTIVFGAGEPNETSLTSRGGSDLYVARFDPDGALVWVEQGGGDWNDDARSLAFVSGSDGAEDALFVTARMDTDATFDTFSVVRADGAYYAPTMFARLDSAGELVWAKQFGDGLNQDVDFFDIAILDQRVIVSGNVSQVLTVGEGEPSELTFGDPCFGVDGFLLSYRFDGTLEKAQPWGGPGYDFPQGFAVGPRGIAVAGQFSESATLGPGLELAGGNEAFVGLWDASLKPIDAVLVSGLEAQSGTAVAFMPDGGWIAAGGFGAFDPSRRAHVVLGEGDPNRTVLTSAGGDSMWLGRWDAAGALVWARELYASGANERVNAIEVTPSGRVVLVGGYIDQTLSIDAHTLESRGTVDGFIVVLD